MFTKKHLHYTDKYSCISNSKITPVLSQNYTHINKNNRHTWTHSVLICVEFSFGVMIHFRSLLCLLSVISLVTVLAELHHDMKHKKGCFGHDKMPETKIKFL